MSHACAPPIRPGFSLTLRAFCILASLTFTSGVTLAAERVYSPPRLEDGHVDLQGMWALTNITSLERAAHFKTLVISATQAEIRNAQRSTILKEELRASDQFVDTLFVEPILGELHSSIIIDPQDGLIPGTALFHRLRAERRAALLTAFDGPEQRPTSERCLQQFDSAPPILFNASESLHYIVQTPGVVVMAAEAMHDTRIIRMNAKHRPATIQSWLGDSVAAWEGDTLVVETKYFARSSEARASGANVYFVSPQTTVVERFTRVSDDELHYVFTVDDPAYYTRTWTGENSFRRSWEKMFEVACHEGNYSLGYALQGARAQEAQDGPRSTASAPSLLPPLPPPAPSGIAHTPSRRPPGW